MIGAKNAEIFRQKLVEVENSVPLVDSDLNALQNEVQVLIQQNNYIAREVAGKEI